MAIFQVNKNNPKKNNNKKIIGWTLLIISTIVFLFSATSIIPALQHFFLGVFGIFVYPLTILGLIISLALLNNKKYVMPKRYAIFLSLSLYFFLAIIQLIILGSPNGLAYGQFIALNYSKTFTAGGMLIGFIPSTLAYLMGLAATYVVLALALVTCVAFFVEAVISLKKTTAQQKPIKLQIKEKQKNNQDTIKVQPQPKPQPKVMFDGNREEEEKKELSAREKLGLVGKGYRGQETFEVKLPDDEFNNKVPSGMTMKEYLLSPPKVDMEKFMEHRPKQKFTQNNLAQNTLLNNNVTIQDINKNISDLKSNETIKPSSYVHEESYDLSGNQQIRRGNLPDVKPEEITSEAEDIIRSVVKQEKIEREEDINDNYSNNSEIENDSEYIDYSAIDESSQRENFGRGEFPRDNRLNGLDQTNNSFKRDSDFARDTDKNAIISDRKELAKPQQENPQPKPVDEIERRKRFVELEDDKPQEKIKPYKYTKPPIDLITTQSDDLSLINNEIPMKRVALENALENFGVPAKVQNVVIGPTVTRYEIEMPEGISVKRILSLDADIAYALSANGQIRIEAPIPGRSIVGIEVPNSKVAKVSIKDVLQAKEFALSPSPLTFALGKDITGNVKVCNLQKMPHLLVAGTTGSGKSVCLNSIIISILYKASPDDVKFIMIDPKQVELSMYEGLPHLVVPRVITDPTKAVNALQWTVDEMERRFKLISEERVRNIGEYNKLDKVLQNKVKKMPYLVVIFDEFADFMAVAKNEIEDKIRRIAQKARAAGIHLILATQRPSTDVVTGTLKGNLPSRIAFKVASRVDSEVILGCTGAEKLLGYGDMLYKPSDAEPSRLQGCFIDTPETKDIVNFIIQNNEEVFDEEAINAINNPGKTTNGGGENNGVDPLLPQALKICIDNGVASTTMVQRKLSIGYPRAARIVDQMEERGYISSAEGSKQRAVYITIDEFYSIFGDIYD